MLLTALPLVACGASSGAIHATPPTGAANTASSQPETNDDPLVIDLVTNDAGVVLVSGRLAGKRLRVRLDAAREVTISIGAEQFRPIEPRESVVLARLMELELDKIDASAARLVVSVVQSMRAPEVSEPPEPQPLPAPKKNRTRGLTFEDRSRERS
jgi:hypothetical protein